MMNNWQRTQEEDLAHAQWADQIDQENRRFIEEYDQRTGESKMVDRSEMYKSNSEFLASDDVGDREFKMKISHTKEHQFDDRQTPSLVVMFEGAEKGLVLNKTNFKRIAAAYGTDDDNWKGQAVIVYTEPVEYQGKETMGLRVRIPKQTVEAEDTGVPF